MGGLINIHIVVAPQQQYAPETHPRPCHHAHVSMIAQHNVLADDQARRDQWQQIVQAVLGGLLEPILREQASGLQA